MVVSMNIKETEAKRKERLHRREEAFSLNAIEGQTPSEEDRAMFEMFDEKGLNFEQRRDHIVTKTKKPPTD